MIQVKEWNIRHNGQEYKIGNRYELDAALEQEFVRKGWASYVEYVAREEPLEKMPEELVSIDSESDDIRQDLDEYTLDELRVMSEELEVPITKGAKKSVVIDEIIASGRAEEYFDE